VAMAKVVVAMEEETAKTVVAMVMTMAMTMAMVMDRAVE